MSEGAAPVRFAPGDRVRTRAADPDGHTRLPRYARGRTGRIVALTGSWPLADEVVRRRAEPGAGPGVGPGAGPPEEPVYVVAFDARELWGEGAHEVTLELWQSYLEPYGRDTQSQGQDGEAAS
ncbi:nitrile hydratase subunit beta [Streptomyces sp. HNM0575]|uniref:SH3-like domain-containing protein n=1 Tax=Streptomyces sp. HNM0575 TaxID=2716338 RepID=UPI00145E28AB|nr:nitrile hydratase subunit beta [Streptomyces sp. HNM0575]